MDWLEKKILHLGSNEVKNMTFQFLLFIQNRSRLLPIHALNDTYNLHYYHFNYNNYLNKIVTTIQRENGELRSSNLYK